MPQPHKPLTRQSPACSPCCRLRLNGARCVMPALRNRELCFEHDCRQANSLGGSIEAEGLPAVAGPASRLSRKLADPVPQPESFSATIDLQASAEPDSESGDPPQLPSFQSIVKKYSANCLFSYTYKNRGCKPSVFKHLTLKILAIKWTSAPGVPAAALTVTTILNAAHLLLISHPEPPPDHPTP